MATAGVAGGRITAGVGANLIGQHAQDRNQDATVYVGNLDVQVNLSRQLQALVHLLILLIICSIEDTQMISERIQNINAARHPLIGRHS